MEKVIALLYESIPMAKGLYVVTIKGQSYKVLVK